MHASTVNAALNLLKENTWIVHGIPFVTRDKYTDLYRGGKKGPGSRTKICDGVKRARPMSGS